MNIKGCQGCLYYRKVHDCAVKNNMQIIYNEIKDADYVIIGSPVYICQVSAQTKLLLDRLYPLAEIDKAKHTPRFGKKKLIMVYTAKYLKGMGLEHYKTLIATKAFEKNSTKSNKKILDSAYKLGIKISSN